MVQQVETSTTKLESQDTRGKRIELVFSCPLTSTCMPVMVMMYFLIAIMSSDLFLSDKGPLSL